MACNYCDFAAVSTRSYRSGEGLLRRTRNLCLSTLIEAVRDQTRIVDLKQVNRVLLQPHWRKDYDSPLPATPLVA
jgi:hypothetical protein